MVDEPHVARSRSREETFVRDLDDPAEVEAQVARLATEVATSVFAEGRRVTHVAVKLRTASSSTRDRIGNLPEPTGQVADVVAGALRALARFELDRPTRLLGVRVVLE